VLSLTPPKAAADFISVPPIGVSLSPTQKTRHAAIGTGVYIAVRINALIDSACHTHAAEVIDHEVIEGPAEIVSD